MRSDSFKLWRKIEIIKIIKEKERINFNEIKRTLTKRFQSQEEEEKEEEILNKKERDEKKKERIIHQFCINFLSTIINEERIQEIVYKIIGISNYHLIQNISIILRNSMATVTYYWNFQFKSN